MQRHNLTLTLSTDWYRRSTLESGRLFAGLGAVAGGEQWGRGMTVCTSRNGSSLRGQGQGRV